MMHSLRARLLTGVIGAMVLLLAIFSLLLYTLIARALVHQFDASLTSIAQILAASAERDGDRIEIELAVQQMPEFRDAAQPTYYELWGPDGTVVEKSPLLGARDLPRVAGSWKTPASVPLPDGGNEPQRAVGLTFVPKNAEREGEETAAHPAGGGTFTLAVARDASDLHGQLRSLRWLLATASAVVIAISILIGALVVGRGLGPLHRIAAEIADIKADDLTTRIGAERAPAEVAPIKDRLNELLSRLEASFKRERQFNADVAHELRTPLAGIRSTIEVTLARTRDPADYQAALSDCLEITEGMQSMVGHLLMLARLDARQITFRTELVRPAELVNGCWRSFAGRAREREIALENGIAADVILPSDREHLSMVLSNLLDNAVEYAGQGGRVWTAARRTENSVEITVSNTGCQLTTEQVPHVFDFFWRGDSSRQGTGTHCGLGLALVRRIVMALGGSATAEVQPGGVFTAQLTFPVRP